MEKKFVIRNSLATDAFQHPQTRNIYNMCAIVFVGLSFYTLGREYLTTGRVTFGFEVIKASFVHLDKAIFVWLCCFASACALFFIFKVWLSLRACTGGVQSQCFEPMGGSFLPVVTEGGGPNRPRAEFVGLATVFDWFGFLCLALYYFYSFRLVTDAIRYFNFNFSCILIISLEQPRLLMKVHAFVRTKASEELPRLSFPNYLYFLFAPTLIYRDAYPRNKTINWKFVAQCLLEFVTGVFALTFCVENCFPPSERWAQKFTVNEVLLVIVEIIGYAAILLVCPFFIVFHSFHNFFAEILQFGDRLFYLDWWNEHTVNGWLVKNDKVVQDWLYYYVYRDFRKHIYDNALLAKLTVFLLSFVVHEWVVFCCTGGLVPVIFFVFVVVGIPLTFFDIPKNILSVVVFWCSLILFSAIGFVFYTLEWYARWKNPLEDPTLWESLVPRFLTCNCVLKI